MERRSVEVVVLAQGSRALLWSPLGTNYVCEDADELGRWAVDDIWKNDKVDPCEATSPDGKWVKLAAKALDAIPGVKVEQGDSPDRVAVHCVVSLDDKVVGIVIPPQGAPRIVKGPGEVGAALLAIANDKSQPRVAAAPPPNPWGEVAERAGGVLVDMMNEGATG